MSTRPEEGALLRGYLLDALPESERLELAARYFADDELFERLEAEEADLIDAYISGELSSEERHQFEETLPAFPGRVDRVAFARALQTLSADRAGAGEPAARGGSRRSAPALWAMAAALAVAAVGGLWVARRSAGFEQELRILRAERDGLARKQGELMAEIERLRARPAVTAAPGPVGSIARTVTFLLSAGLTRETAAGNRLLIPSDAAVVRLQLPIPPPPAARYRARIERPDGTEVLRRDGLAATQTSGGLAVVLDLVAGALPEGDYIALLEDLSGPEPEPAEEYAFRVIR